MPKFTLIVTVDHPAEVASANAWLDKWAHRVEFLSENYGCGCCIDMYDGEGPEEAIADAGVMAVHSDWTDGVKTRPA